MARGKIRFELKVAPSSCADGENCQGEILQYKSMINGKEIILCQRHKAEIIWCERMLTGTL